MSADTKPNGEAFVDQRHAPRQRVLLSGKVVEPSGSISTDCTIRDLNDAGAKLRIPQTVPVGEHVYLIETRSGATHQVKVAWRRNGDVGVAYEKEVPLEDTKSPVTRMLRRLWMGGY